MLAGDNSILQKATDAKEYSERAEIVENAQIDILGQRTENKGANITKEQLVAILNQYFKPTEATAIPDEISSRTDVELTTIDEKHKIYLSEVFKGTLRNSEENHPIPTDIYVALYNDNTMVFSNNSNDIDASKLQSSVVNIKDMEYDLWGPDYGIYRSYVTKVIILNKIVPTSCSGWFNGFYNLTEIVSIDNLDTSLVTSMASMFKTCEKLVADISSFETSNVTDMSGMFANGMNDDFYGAVHVTGWQSFDVSNVTNMQSIFYDGGAGGGTLTEVLDFCIRATKIPIENKTLNYLRLGSQRASECETLPNYQSFIDAGWTTGY